MELPIEVFFNFMKEDPIMRIIMGLVCFTVLYFTVTSLLINFIAWIPEAYNKIKRKILGLDVTVTTLKYDIYIVGYPGGEIFYADEKRIRKLKEKNLISWNRGIGKYIFEDKDTEDVIKTIKPLIEFYNSDRKVNIE
jgi:hypothetical protein